MYGSWSTERKCCHSLYCAASFGTTSLCNVLQEAHDCATSPVVKVVVKKSSPTGLRYRSAGLAFPSSDSRQVNKTFPLSWSVPQLGRPSASASLYFPSLVIIWMHADEGEIYDVEGEYEDFICAWVRLKRKRKRKHTKNLAKAAYVGTSRSFHIWRHFCPRDHYVHPPVGGGSWKCYSIHSDTVGPWLQTLP